MLPALSMLLVLFLAVLFAALGVGGIWWALFWDKARGRRRCPRCWHDLSFTQGMQCGECGYVGKTQWDFLRTRRRYGAAALLLVMVLAVTGWARYQATGSGWAGLMPSPALVALAPVMEPRSMLEEGWAELARRVWRRQLSPDTQVALAGTLVTMTDGAEVRALPASMLSDVLLRRPAELDTDESGMNEAERLALQLRRMQYAQDMDDALAHAPLALKATMPAQWMPGAPLVVHASGALWGQRTEWRARIQQATATPVDSKDQPTGPAAPLAPLRDAWVVWSSAGGLRGNGPTRSVLALQPLSAPRARVDVTLAVQTRRWQWQREAWGPWTDSPPEQLSQTVATDGPHLLAASQDEALQENAQRAFQLPVVAWSDNQRPIALRFNMNAYQGSTNADVLVGATLELLERGQVRRRLRIWWVGGTTVQPDAVGWAVEDEDVEALRRLRESTDGWTLRIRGDLPTALRALPAQAKEDTPWRVWTGTLEAPVQMEPGRAPAPERTWRVEPAAPAEAAAPAGSTAPASP